MMSVKTIFIISAELTNVIHEQQLEIEKLTAQNQTLRANSEKYKNLQAEFEVPDIISSYSKTWFKSNVSF